MDDRINIPNIKLSEVEGLVKKMKNVIGNKDIELSFEFFMTSFFPLCWNNIQEALKQQYTKGYIDGCKNCDQKTNL